MYDVCMYSFGYGYVHVQIHMCAHVQGYFACMMYVCVHVDVDMYVCTYVWVFCMYDICVFIRVWICVHMCAYVYGCQRRCWISSSIDLNTITFCLSSSV